MVELRQRGYNWQEGLSYSQAEDVDKPRMTFSRSWALPSNQK